MPATARKVSQQRCKVFAVGCDWLTATGSSPEGRSSLWDLGNRLLHGAEAEGQHATGWHANGYRGWRCEGVGLGVREDSVILRLSGLQAAKQWREAAAAGENLSRLDLAVDCEADPPVPGLGAQVYEDAGHVPSKNGRPPGRSRFVDGYGGQTTYIGSRTSEQFGRLYDKGVEQRARAPGAWWRWEVEFKGERAWSLGRTLTPIQAVERPMLALVAEWFRDRTGHAPPSSSRAVKYFEGRKISTDEERLHWLASAVRPTVATLIERLGRRRVLTALGIPAEERSVGSNPETTLMRVS